MKPILEIKDISKKYKIRSQTKPYLSLRESISSLLKPGDKTEEFWALKDVSFTVRPGETIGIIGKNGAGKSTLLKILSKITPPTKGSVISRGRIASLLEVGTGFHPELSGRENIYLNGSILGMKKAEIRKQFDAIIDFSGVEKFVDTPLKHYSSGMQLRLAFAVAAYLEPEILIIDEVLAVGDSEFQKKCMGKMKDVSQAGRTIIFVSHDLTAISNLTSQCVFLNKGVIKNFAATSLIIEEYLNEGADSDHRYSKPGGLLKQPGITLAEMKTSLPDNVHEHGKPLNFNLEIFIPEPLSRNLWISIHIIDAKGRGILHLTNGGEALNIGRQIGMARLSVTMPSVKLYMGRYYVSVYLSGPPNSDVYERLVQVLKFDMVMNGNNHEFGWWPDTCVYVEDVSWRNNNV